MNDQSARESVQAEAGRCDDAIRELDREVATQQEDIDESSVRLAETTSRLDQLRSQRDLLQARLKIAQARAQVFGGQTEERSKRLRFAMTLAVCTSLLAGAGLFLVVKKRRQTPVVQAPPKAKDKTEIASRPGDAGRFPSRQLLGMESELKATGTCVVFAPRAAQRNPYHLSLAIGDDRGTVRTATVQIAEGPATGRLTIGRPFHGHRKPISALAYSPDGSLLASGDSSGDIRIWDKSKGKADVLYRRITGLTDRISIASVQWRRFPAPFVQWQCRSRMGCHRRARDRTSGSAGVEQGCTVLLDTGAGQNHCCSRTCEP